MKWFGEHSSLKSTREQTELDIDKEAAFYVLRYIFSHLILFTLWLTNLPLFHKWLKHKSEF